MERLHAATVSPSRSLAVATAELPLRVLPDMAGVAAPRKDSAFGTCRVPLGDAQPAGMPPPPPLQPATSHQPPAASQANAKGEELRMPYVRLVRQPSTAATLHCGHPQLLSPISAHLRPSARAAPRRIAPRRTTHLSARLSPPPGAQPEAKGALRARAATPRTVALQSRQNLHRLGRPRLDQPRAR